MCISVQVIQTADGSQRLLPRPSKWTLGMPITAIRFMPPKLVWAVACNSHGEVFAFNPEREGFETLFKEPQQTYALDISPDGTELATGGVDKKIRIYTLQPGSVLGMPSELHDPCESATDGAVTNRILVRKPETSPYHLFRVDAPKHTRLHFPGGRPNQIVDTTVRPYVLTRCYGTPDILDSPDVPEPAAYVNNPKLAPPLREYVPTSPGLNITEGHSMRIMALRYHPQKPSLLFSAGWDNLVKLWDTRLQTGPIWQIYGPHVASPDGLDVDDNYLLTASWRAKESIESTGPVIA
ncbi:Transcriptional repressor tup12 [Paragonimus heterotremus]|uniref:Transcriptional repressor tup12 n=1 Tax=Paragonimus heterotremus TaxID=100268 RepID=A0A8J4SXF0_9TREM|nr:Transcriptional repressor tup12 [Paragonimus heterotremus]